MLALRAAEGGIPLYRLTKLTPPRRGLHSNSSSASRYIILAGGSRGLAQGTNAAALAQRCRFPRSRRRPTTTTAAALSNSDSSEPPNFYELLEVSADATDEDVKLSYRRLQKQYHPDVCGDGGTKSRLLNLAYSTLLNEQSRKSYEQELRASGRAGAAPTSWLRSVEGLVPVLDHDVLLVEALDCATSSTPSPDAVCNALDEETAVSYLRQWAQTLAFGCDLPLPYPIQCDSVAGGVRVGVVTTAGQQIRLVGELRFVVVPPREGPAGGGFEVEVQRRYAGGSPVQVAVGEALPGEDRILREFASQMKQLRGEAPEKPKFQLSGFLAAFAQGALGGLPFGVGGTKDDRTYEGYFLKSKDRNRTD